MRALPLALLALLLLPAALADDARAIERGYAARSWVDRTTCVGLVEDPSLLLTFVSHGVFSCLAILPEDEEISIVRAADVGALPRYSLVWAIDGDWRGLACCYHNDWRWPVPDGATAVAMYIESAYEPGEHASAGTFVATLR